MLGPRLPHVGPAAAGALEGFPSGLPCTLVQQLLAVQESVKKSIRCSVLDGVDSTRAR